MGFFMGGRPRWLPLWRACSEAELWPLWCWWLYYEGETAWTSAHWTGDVGLVIFQAALWEPGNAPSLVFGFSLQDRQEDRDDDAGDEDHGDQSPVADVLVGHVQAGEGGDEEANGYHEKEDLQG
jgi:hypothetical protein